MSTRTGFKIRAIDPIRLSLPNDSEKIYYIVLNPIDEVNKEIQQLWKYSLAEAASKDECLPRLEFFPLGETRGEIGVYIDTPSNLGQCLSGIERAVAASFVLTGLSFCQRISLSVSWRDVTSPLGDALHTQSQGNETEKRVSQNLFN